MRKRILVKMLCQRFPAQSPQVITKMADIILNMIMEAVAEGRQVEIRNFGTFFRGKMGRRLLHNPGSGGVMEVAARMRPRFRPGRKLREKVNTSA